MVSTNMYTLTHALKGVFVDTHMTDQSTNKSGPSFPELTRMEEFWEVGRNKTGSIYINFLLLISI
jgi:hypothetical protein